MLTWPIYGFWGIPPPFAGDGSFQTRIEMKFSQIVPVAFGFAVFSGASPLDGRARENTNPLDILSNAAGDHAHSGDSPLSSIVSQLQLGSTPPDSPQSALAALQKHFPGNDSSLEDVANAITQAGLVPKHILHLLNGYLNTELNSVKNHNPPLNQSVYTSQGPEDTSYTTSEEALRAAIHIPKTFSYGRNGKVPVILVPGTGIPAGTTYYFSFSKLGESAVVDVVWLNLPRTSLSDAQVSAEYVAYAIHYISALCAGKQVAIITWSQGALNTQWALKYWPSTRGVVQDFLAMSPDFHGTKVGSLACPALDNLICAPAIWQQGWDTEFVRTLRANGGDSAYVPTTSIYSAFDEIVQPMSGPNASAILKDSRGVGVTNAQVQSVCAHRVAGGFYTHEGILYNPLAWALAIDAITHEGPGRVSRLDLANVCNHALAPELALDDLFGTEGLLLIAVANLLTYQPQPKEEPPIKGYASSAPSGS